MKVSINGRNSPCPVAAAAGAGAGAGAAPGVASAAAGAGVGAGGSIVGSLLNGLFSYRQQKRQIQHDKDMAGLNQQYILEQMEKGNEYQVEQWNRENAYNDPAAVRARYEAAGLNSRAAMGEGSASGAGISSGLSGAPSGSTTGHSSNIMAAAPFSGLGDAIMQGARLGAQNKRDQADAARAYEEAKSTYLDNQEKEFMKENGVWQARLTDEVSKSLVSSYNAQMKKIDAALYDFEHTTDVLNKFQAGQNMLKEYEKMQADIDRLKKLNELTDEDKKLIGARVSQVEEQTKQIKANNVFYSKFGFYPPTGSTLESALVGLGAKGIGQMAEAIAGAIKDERKMKKIRPTEEFVQEFKDAPEAERVKVVRKFLYTPNSHYANPRSLGID